MDLDAQREPDALGKTRLGTWYWTSPKLMWAVGALDLFLLALGTATLMLVADAPGLAAFILSAYGVSIVNVGISIYNLSQAGK